MANLSDSPPLIEALPFSLLLYEESNKKQKPKARVPQAKCIGPAQPSSDSPCDGHSCPRLEKGLLSL